MSRVNCTATYTAIFLRPRFAPTGHGGSPVLTQTHWHPKNIEGQFADFPALMQEPKSEPSKSAGCEFRFRKSQHY
jgi:hypothetical protein